jgi:hypothetical protein
LTIGKGRNGKGERQHSGKDHGLHKAQR